MELVVGLSHSKLVRIVTDQGCHEEVAAQCLRKRGVPVGQSIAEPTITDFGTWRSLSVNDANSYPKAFGIETDMSNHEVFEFFDGHYRYFVPAIVIIKALLKNKPGLLRAIFKPQGLEQFISPVFGDAGLLTCFMPDRRPGELDGELLSWLYGYPSCRNMFQSVFQYAVNGRIGVSLPIGAVEIRPSFMEKNSSHKVRYVTELGLSVLTTGEVPLSFCNHTDLKVRFYRSTSGCKTRLVKERLPLRENGEAGLSDAEWKELQPLFIGLPNLQHDRRRILDGVLYKLASGKPWRKCIYSIGTWSNASNLHQVLVKNGQWSLIAELLKRHRAY